MNSQDLIEAACRAAGGETWMAWLRFKNATSVPAAWLDPASGDGVTAARKTMWMRHDGGYRLIAEKYTVPLYAHQPAPTSEASQAAALARLSVIDAEIEAAPVVPKDWREFLQTLVLGPQHPGYVSGIPLRHYADFLSEMQAQAKYMLEAQK